MKKNDYTSPKIDCLNWDLEGVICASGDTQPDVLDFDLDLPDYSPSMGEW